MADYSLVKNNGTVCGFWLQNSALAEDKHFVAALIVKEQISAPSSIRTVPNQFDNAGGCFLMFDSAKAPGE